MSDSKDNSECFNSQAELVPDSARMVFNLNIISNHDFPDSQPRNLPITLPRWRDRANPISSILESRQTPRKVA
jgi:hypothetical protein